MSSLGPFCDGLQLNSVNLASRLGGLTAQDLSNGVIYEIDQYVHHTYDLQMYSLIPSFEAAFNVVGLSRTLTADIAELKQRRRSLVKNGKKGELVDLMNNPFQLRRSPLKPRPSSSSSSASSPVPRKRSFTAMFSNDVAELTCQKLAQENKNLVELNQRLREETEELKKQVTKLEEALQQRDCRVLRQTIKRKGESVKLWKGKYQHLKVDCRETVTIKTKLSQARKELSRLRHAKAAQTIRYRYKHDNAQKRQKNQQGLKHQHPHAKQILEKRIVEKNSQIRFLENELLISEETTETTDSACISTKVDGKSYSEKVRLCSYILQDSGVAQMHCSDTLRKIIKTLTGQDLADLPAYSTQNAFTREMRALSIQQVSEELTGTENNTIKFDGTTKRSGHLVGVEAAKTTGETLLLGMKLQSSGTASAYTKTIVAQCESVGLKLSQVANTMTDRCITNAAIHRELETLKGNTLNQFKCAMHPLDTMAKQCNAIVRETETNTLKDIKGVFPFKHRAESMTQATVRTTTKLFHSTQYFSETLHSYLASKFGPGGLYYRYVGNRFHIFFLSSGMLYCYKDAMNEYFTTILKPRNGVEMGIHNSLNQPIIPVTLRALGLVGKIVTGPWMRLVGQELSILDMNTYFEEARGKLSAWSTDASQLMVEDPPSIFETIPVLKDRVLESLTMATPDNGQVKELLQSLLQTCLDVVDRQLQSQLPNGEFWQPSDRLRAEASSCVATNISCERNFAIADAQMARAANAKPEFVEARVMYKINKTAKWLLDQEEDIRKLKITQSRRDGRQLLKDDKQFRQTLVTNLHERIRQMREAGQQKDDKTRDKFEKWLETVIGGGGLWETNEVETILAGRTITAQKKLLTAQIQVRMKVLGTIVEDRIALSTAKVPALVQHLLKVIEKGVPDEHSDLVEIMQNPKGIVGLEFVQKWSMDEGQPGQWCSGTIREYLDTNSEYKMEYPDEICYMTVDELLTDVIMGNLDLHYQSD